MVLSIIFFLVSGYLTSSDNIFLDSNVYDVTTTESEEEPIEFEPDSLDMKVTVPDFMDQEAWESRLEDFVLELNTSAGKKRFVDELYSRAPLLMLVLLPLMAFVSWVLHLFSRRYYVEHLLMLVHFHAFVFFFFLLVLALSKLANLAEMMMLASWLKVYAFLLVFYYFYKMLRNTLTQSRGAALFRVSVYSFSYILFAAILLLAASLFTAFTF